MLSTVFTCGDINGIGPEIVLKTINKIKRTQKRKIIFVCPKNVFLNTTKYVTPKFEFIFSKSIPADWNTKKILILDLGYAKQSIGKETKTSGQICYNSIIKACELAKNNIIESIVTAPISKLAFAKANIKFPGHTELFADYFNVNKFTMMFVSNRMKAALVTIHEPIKKVPKLISKSRIINTFEVVLKSLKNDFGILNPKIAILGLNPHSGENGKIGREEKEIIIPVIKSFKNNLFGPMVPDAFYGTKLYKDYDCTIGLYHDQVLIPFKLLNFDTGVNYTAGLPIVRTSPDHGTAFDIAGKGIADEESMLQAFKYAELISKNRRSLV